MTWTRRDFLTTGTMLASSLFIPRRRVAAATAADAPPALGVVVDGRAEAAARGAVFGVEEARHTSNLLRRPLDIATFEGGDRGPGALVEELTGREVAAVVAVLPDPTHQELDEAAAAAGILVVDARAVSASPAKGAPEAVPSIVYRTGAPEAAYERALEQHSGDGSAQDRWRAELWTPELYRYGAEQLNARYRQRFEEGMGSQAWAAWFAVKALSEAALRAASPAELQERLAGPRAAFDGHKGAPLTFEPKTGQLIQPLYVVGPEETVQVEWPLDVES